MRLPIRIGQGAAGAVFNLNAVDLDGSTEALNNTTANTFGVANAWTTIIWLKATTVTNGRFVYWDAGAGNASTQSIFFSGGKFLIYITNSAATLTKQYAGNTTVATGTQYMVTTTWDGTNLKLYLNGVEDTPYNKVTDATITMADDAKKIWIANQANTLYGNIIMAHKAMWNTTLSSTEITALYDSGNGYKLDVRNTKGDYTSTSALKHQWVPGKDGTSITTMGQDYVASGNINIGDNAVNVSSADIVTF